MQRPTNAASWWLWGLVLNLCLRGKPSLLGVPWCMKTTILLQRLEAQQVKKNTLFTKARFKEYEQSPKGIIKCGPNYTAMTSRPQQIPVFMNMRSTVSTIGFEWPAWLCRERHLLLFCNNRSGSAWQLNSKSLVFESYALNVCQVINFTAVLLAK